MQHSKLQEVSLPGSAVPVNGYIFHHSKLGLYTNKHRGFLKENTWWYPFKFHLWPAHFFCFKDMISIQWMVAKSCTTNRVVKTLWIMGWIDHRFQLVIRISLAHKNSMFTICSQQGGTPPPPVMYKLVYNSHEYYRYNCLINLTDIGLICTNLAN